MAAKLQGFYIFLLFCGIGIVGYNFYVANQMKYDFGGDAGDFIHLGLSLAKTGQYGHLENTQNLAEDFRTGRVSKKNYNFRAHSTWRPPVWPVIIALTFLLSGYSITFLLVLKFSLHLLGCWFFYRTLKFFKLKEILVAIGAFLYLVNPGWQLYSRVFLSEPLTLFFVTLFTWSLVKYYYERKGLLLHGFIGGILILSHPYYIFLPFSIWLMLFLRGRLKLKSAISISLICIAVVSFWVIRNFIVLDAEGPVITTSSGAVMAKGWNKKVPALHTNTKGDLADEGLVLQDFHYEKKNYEGEVGYSNLYRDATFDFIQNNPGLIGPIIWTKLRSAFNPFPETPRAGVLETGRVIYQVLALLAVLFVLIKGPPIMRSLALGLIVSTILITVITYSGFRFRMPQTAIEILLITFSFGLLNRKGKEKFRHGS